MTGGLDPATLLVQLPPVAVYAVVFAFVLAESVLLIGAFVPTLALLLTAGALSRQVPGLTPVLLIAVAASAVVTGDALAHGTGRVLAGRVRTGRLGRRIPAAAWDRTAALMERHGGRTVLICRFLPVLRTLAPHLTGASGLPYRRIAPYSAVAAVVWAGGEILAGRLAASWVERLIASGGTVLAGAALAVAAGAVWLVRRRRTGTRTDTRTGAAPEGAEGRDRGRDTDGDGGGDGGTPRLAAPR